MYFFKKLFLKLGVIAFLTGFVPISVDVFDFFTCKPAMARVESVGIKQLEISFKNEDGKDIKAVAFATQLDLDFKANGDQGLGYYYHETAIAEGATIPILYRNADGVSEPRITHPFSFESKRIFFVTGAAGIIMLMVQAVL